MNAIAKDAQIEQRPRPWWLPSLTVQIFIGLFIGILIGWLRPAWGLNIFFLRDIFLNLIKSLIAPLVFSTLVVGIAGGGDLKKVGRMGAKALLYFEIVTTLALVIGLLVVNTLHPGRGVTFQENASAGSLKQIEETQPKTLTETIVHVFPSSLIDAMARGDVLQIVMFAVIFACAVTAIGERGKPVVILMDSVSQAMFRYTHYVMYFAPVGVCAAMAHSVATQGLGVIKSLGFLIGSLYLALVIFIVFVFGTVMLICQIPILKFIKAVREPATIAFATTSSESALPKAMENMERFGVPPGIVGFVMPTGYSFNLDGTTLYLALASVFVAQAAEATTGKHMGIGTQIVMMLTLILTSKGVAAVPRASMVILFATLNSFVPGYGILGVSLIVGVDEIMDMARTFTNVIGNCLATCVVARWEGEFDDARANAFGTAAEVPIDAGSKDLNPVVALAPATV